jgi:hypothetical protein
MEGVPKMPNKSEGDESEVDLEQRGEAATAEILAATEELDANLQEIATLAESEEMTPTVNERLLASITQVAEKAKDTYLGIMTTNLVATGALVLNDYLIMKGDSVIEDGSVLAYANNALLAGVVLFQAIKSVQFGVLKYGEVAATKGVEKGTIEGMREGVDFVQKTYREHELNENIPTTPNEISSIYGDFMDAFSMTGYRKAGITSAERDERHKRAMEHVKTHMSQYA